MSQTMSPNTTNRDVGVAIALRHHRKQLQQQQQQQLQQQQSAGSPVQATVETQKRELSSSSSLLLLSSSASASASKLCFQRPSSTTQLHHQHHHQKHIPDDHGRRQNKHHRHLWWHDLMFGVSLYLFCIYLPFMYQLLQSFYVSTWCPVILTITKRFMESCIASDGGGDAAWSDLVIVLILSTSLAVVRIALVSWLVDMQSSRDLEAMVRCKSIHLLSSAYPPSLNTPTRSTQRKRVSLTRFNNISTSSDQQHDLALFSNNYMDGDNADHCNDFMVPVLPSLDGDDTSCMPSKATVTEKEAEKDTSLSSSCKTGKQLSSSSSTSAMLLLQPRRKEETKSFMDDHQESAHGTNVDNYNYNDNGNDDDELDEDRPMLKRSDSWLESTWESVRRSSEKALLYDNHSYCCDNTTTTNTSASVGSGGVVMLATGGAVGMVAVEDDVINPRLHAAPRYATAVFRCLYGIFSLSTAWFGFSSSNFWPPSVGGSSKNGATTRNCWNLKGSPGMEEDFDDLNALLKFYYLLQGSYHLHSGAFHVLTMMIVWARRRKTKHDATTSSTSRTAGSIIATKPFTSYWRSLFQHGIALLLIGGSHLFASTRRLGAIGSFALDLSSFVLHLLQVCINAPYNNSSNANYASSNNNNNKNNNFYIKVFHYGVVIPIFVYCRFYVWPFVVWKSAWLESKDWLQQMESTMFPGIYRAMIWLFTLLTLVLMGLNMILLKRLVHHPHLQRMYSSSNNMNK